MDLAVERLRSLRVVDVMNRNVTTITADATLADIASLFTEHDISWAPVVDGQGQCIGVLSAKDYLRYQAKRNAEGEHAGTSKASVRDTMTTAIQSIASQAGLLRAAQIMCAQHLHRLLVLDEKGRPLGVISSMDITAALVNVTAEMGL